MGKYIYAIIPCPEDPCCEFASPGMSDDGEPGGNVHTVQLGDLATVVSDYPQMDFQEFERTRANMMVHTKVLEEVMQHFTILPVRFGTVGATVEAIQEQVLERRRNEFLGLIAEVDGLQEMGLKSLWREEIIFPEIVAGSSPGMRRLRLKIKARSEEASYYDRMKLGEMIQEAMEKKREVEAEKIVARLRPLIRKEQVNQKDRIKLNQVLADKMVINAALLVEAARMTEFDAAVQGVKTEQKHRMLFKYVGPVPPYNFVLIIIRWDKEDEDE